EGHADTSLWFADPDRGSGNGQFSDIPTFQRATGAPLLVDHAGWVDCRLWDVHEGGDHMIVVGQVVDLGADGAGPPLVYRQGEYGGFARQ
ncbi:MAG: flavin reductase family protein, partial [Nitriliruptoraceae bacterium]